MKGTKAKSRKESYDKIVIGDEYQGPERLELICNQCNCLLVKISDRSGNNEEWFCRKCDIAYPDTKQVRRKHKISTPDYDQEAAVTTTQGIPDISIRHTPDLRGGFAELQRKGLKFTSYQTTEKE